MAEPFPTEKDLAFWELVAQGLGNKEIAARLHLSSYTARWRVSRLLRVFGLRNRVELAVLWFQGGGQERKTLSQSS